MQKFFPPIPGAVLLVAGMVLLVLFSGCTSIDDSSLGTYTIAVTIPPQEEMVREIGGDHVEVLVMIPPGSDPHTYEPGPGLIGAASRADLYITVGTGLFPIEDSLAGRLKALNPELVVVDSSRGITYLPASGNAGDTGDDPRTGKNGREQDQERANPDPHVWLSLRNGIVMSANIRDALIALDPVHEKEYRGNSDRYRAALADLDRKIAGAFERNDPGMLLVTHPAWGYFARDYHLGMVAIETEGKEPTARDLEALILTAREAGVRVVFVEAQEHPREAEVVAREIGGTTSVIDPLAGDYRANMERIFAAFAEAGNA